MTEGVGLPLWLLAELTYRCPLQCPYCSNPLDYAQHKNELTTQEWFDVFDQARQMGAVQLGFPVVNLWCVKIWNNLWRMHTNLASTPT